MRILLIILLGLNSQRLYSQDTLDIQYLYYSNKNEKIGDLYFIDERKAIGVKTGTHLVMIEDGLIKDQIDVSALGSSSWESIKQVIKITDDQFAVLTQQVAFQLINLSNKLYVDETAKYSKHEQLKKVFGTKDSELLQDKYCIMGVVNDCIFGYYIKGNEKQKNKRKLNPPEYWVFLNGKIININEFSQPLTNDRFYNDWYYWPWRYDKHFTYVKGNLYLISPEANTMFEINTVTGFYKSLEFPKLNKSKSWYYFYDTKQNRSYVANKISESRYRIFLVNGELERLADNLIFIKEIDFQPMAIIGSHIHKRERIEKTKYFSHYLIPLYAHEQKTILNEVEVKDN